VHIKRANVKLHTEELISMKNRAPAHSLLKLAVRSARSAGTYLRKRFHDDDLEITGNYRHDVKLDVDKQTEELLISLIRKKYPDHGFICEEIGRDLEKPDNNWVIDPLDGSVNFSRNIPHFCTSIAFKKEGHYLVGAVYDPMRDELFSAIRGHGAFLNGKPMKRRGITSLEEAVVSGGFFKIESLEEGGKIFEKIARRVKKVRFFGSATLDLCYLACGRVNGYIQHAVNEWDIAAASLIAEEQGIPMEIVESRGKLNVFAADRDIYDALSECCA
jgi:myo-inositol-1(or 4)-monophosphatase